MNNIDHLAAADFSALGEHPVICIDLERPGAMPAGVQAVKIGYDLAGAMPDIDATYFDILITTASNPPAPWVSIPARRITAHLGTLACTVRDRPVSATILCQTLRLNETLPIAAALECESLAYSVLLGGSEFARWRASVPYERPTNIGGKLRIEREADQLSITLANPAQRNAITAQMRDALFEALANALDDPIKPLVTIRGEGACFSTGGALWEFGETHDLAQAHLIRSLHSCARLIDALGERCSVLLHGACIGSGLEIPAAAHRRLATFNAWFQLPEAQMGLIPGAGGTVTITRTIGRHRAAWMMLSGKRISAETALSWGLIHEIVGR